ncbi:hypothetical protein [Burkholderia ubonensis]|nr:hypothetical protein [Burkholderia ubonensis]
MKLIIGVALILALAISIGYVVRAVILPAAEVVSTTLHNATLDNRGLHE